MADFEDNAETQNKETPILYSSDAPDANKLSCIPHAPDANKPFLGQVFQTLENAYNFYERYGAICGFGVRRYTQKRLSDVDKTVFEKHYVCNKAGEPRKKDVDTMEPGESKNTKRGSNFTVTGCKARIVCKLITGSNTIYKIVQFDEPHNHMMSLDEYKHLLRTERQLKFSEQNFIFKVGKINIGPTKAHNIYTGIKGSYENVNGTFVDFKNFKRDINAYIGDSDAHMLITKMKNTATYVSNFSFEYKLEDNKLAAMFWADDVAKAHYKEFGDIVSFDATYRTNKYNMMFVPFTGIDNHKKCVTLGAGLLLNETTEYYVWLLKSFLKAFGVQPKIIVTDQDNAMRNAVATVFTESKHRLCMWHITQKLPSKICSTILDNTNFKKRLNQIIWNMFITTTEFEDQWGKLIEEFNLKENKWLSDIYNIRSRWIPAYFRDMELCGIMRTTSRSESENSFFGNFNSRQSTLVNFMICFEAAMEKQRYRQELLDHQTMDTHPTLATRLKIEKQAATIYTRRMFFLVQIEIVKSVWACSIYQLKTENGLQEYIIKEKKEFNEQEKTACEKWEVEIWPEDKTEVIYDYQVIFNKEDKTVACSCRKFVRRGFLCRHVFCVFKNCDIEEIPEKYILRRWTRDIIPMELKKRKKCSETTEFEKLTNQATSTLDDCIKLIGNNQDKLDELVQKLKKIKTDMESTSSNVNLLSKTDIIEKLLGISKPNVIEIQNPEMSRYKGCGRDARLKSTQEKEKAKKKNGIKPRRCGKCGNMVTNHNKRTCDKNKLDVEANKMGTATNIPPF